MGSGKSWWGHRLAEYTALPLIDLDREIEIFEDMDIPSIFREKGEPHFRRTERAVLESITDRLLEPVGAARTSGYPWQAIVATGGGTPCYSDNMDWMNAHGLTVWLNPSVGELHARLLKETETRPLLQGVGPDGLEDLIRTRLAQRTPFYRMAAVIIEDTAMPAAEFLKLIGYA